MSELLILASFVVIVNFLTLMRKHGLKERPVWERRRALLTTSQLAFLVCDRHQSSRIQSPAWETLRAGERAWWNCFKKERRGVRSLWELLLPELPQQKCQDMSPAVVSALGRFLPFFFFLDLLWAGEWLILDLVPESSGIKAFWWCRPFSLAHPYPYISSATRNFTSSHTPSWPGFCWAAVPSPDSKEISPWASLTSFSGLWPQSRQPQSVRDALLSLCLLWGLWQPSFRTEDAHFLSL